ncbi:MAG: hypothetical protein MR302_06200 [Lachnospiraceae bacterium]|nr:hypothetical protein [Lachnospiraceae bacterium]MDD7378990.1 hypothetical protein [Lachnospiraceae bacterium]
MERKLLEQILEKVNIVGDDVASVKKDVGVLKEDVGVLKEEVKELREDVEVLKEDVGVLKEEVKELREDVEVLKEDVEVLKTDVNVLQKKVTKIELGMEQDALPRLQNIEACYTSTYRRYSDNVERFDQMEKDIELLKSIATEHSKQLQKIS